MQQHTLRDVLEFEGVGLHTGVTTRVKIQPQPAGTGLLFRLGAGGPIVAAVAENVVETRLATTLGDGTHSVSTVEHLLSALFGMGVDNALIEVDGPEIPVMDGSASAFVASIERVGLATQTAPRKCFVADQPFFHRDREAVFVILPADEFRVKFAVDYDAPIGAQYFEGAIDPATYRDEIAPARTFGYLHEYQAMLANGLARGGTLANALVFAPEGPITKLRWPNEVVRHKVLDLIGDLALLGAWPRCEVIAIKSGHRLHAAALANLRALLASRAAESVGSRT
jgi:UDP-3-O-[3-hydroxymyristoyl] N-acetylglucosamine deacetylase